MAININPNRINIQSGSAGKTATRERESQIAGGQAPIPARAALNNIPAPETLQTMIRSAISSLRSGVVWDRGTILNLIA